MATSNRADLVVIVIVTLVLAVFFSLRYSVLFGLFQVAGLLWALWDVGLISRRSH